MAKGRTCSFKEYSQKNSLALFFLVEFLHNFIINAYYQI